MSDSIDPFPPAPEHGPGSEPAFPEMCGLQGVPLAAPDSLGLHLATGEGVLDIGHPEADLDGDGFMEAITLQDERGLTVFTDTDGDGAVDHLATVRFDGSYDSWRLASGHPPDQSTDTAPLDGPHTARWVCTDHGWI